VKSLKAKRREAWQLTAGVGAGVAVLLILYCLSEGAPPSGIGAMAPLITASAALAGVALGSWLAWRQRRKEDDQRRHALATGLLSEIRLLDLSLRDIHDDTTAAYRVMDPFQTAMYDQASANLLLFTPETIRALNLFYNGVHELRTTLARYRIQYPNPSDLVQRYPPRDPAHIEVRLMATNIIDVIPEVVTRLHKAEGRQWPGTLPSLRFRLMGSQLEVPEVKPSIFEDQK
jgi:hypothetical protein